MSFSVQLGGCEELFKNPDIRIPNFLDGIIYFLVEKVIKLLKNYLLYYQGSG